jgi:hypothetical protein
MKHNVVPSGVQPGVQPGVQGGLQARVQRGMSTRAMSALVWVGCASIVCGLNSASRGADFVPQSLTGTLLGSGRLQELPAGVPALLSYDVPVSASGAQLANFESSRNELLPGVYGGQNYFVQAWTQVKCSTVMLPAGSGVRGEVLSYAKHSGPLTGGGGVDRRASARSTSSTQIVLGSESRYRLHGFVGGLADVGVPVEDAIRYGRVRLVGPGGVVHQFEGFSLVTFTGGPFDVTGTLAAGTYSVEVFAQSNARTGQTPNADPMVVTITWNLDPLPACGDLDFNNDSLMPDTTDLDDFLSVFSGGPCSTGDCDSVDFNGDGLLPDSADIDAFLRVFSGGEC